MACCIFLATLIATSRAWWSKIRRPARQHRDRAVGPIEIWSAAWVVAAGAYMVLGVVASLRHDGLLTWREGHDVFLAVLGLTLFGAVKLSVPNAFTLGHRTPTLMAVGPLWLVISTIDVHALGNPSLQLHGIADVLFHGGGVLIAVALAIVGHLSRRSVSKLAEVR